MDITRDEWDIIVVGTGPSGATVARELAKRKKKLLILEKGINNICIAMSRTMVPPVRVHNVKYHQRKH